MADPQGSLAPWEKAIQLAPSSPTAWKRLGYIFCQQEKPDAAIEKLTRAVSLDPQSHGTQKYLGDAWAQKQD